MKINKEAFLKMLNEVIVHKSPVGSDPQQIAKIKEQAIRMYEAAGGDWDEYIQIMRRDLLIGRVISKRVHERTDDPNTKIGEVLTLEDVREIRDAVDDYLNLAGGDTSDDGGEGEAGEPTSVH
jgi:hypothetical protein